MEKEEFLMVNIPAEGLQRTIKLRSDFHRMVNYTN